MKDPGITFLLLSEEDTRVSILVDVSGDGTKTKDLAASMLPSVT